MVAPGQTQSASQRQGSHRASIHLATIACNRPERKRGPNQLPRPRERKDLARIPWAAPGGSVTLWRYYGWDRGMLRCATVGLPLFYWCSTLSVPRALRQPHSAFTEPLPGFDSVGFQAIQTELHFSTNPAAAAMLRPRQIIIPFRASDFGLWTACPRY